MALRQQGMSRRAIAAAVDDGRLLRVRTGAFCAPGVHRDCIVAGLNRGRLSCVSELARRGVFVLRLPDHPHIHVVPSASRLGESRAVRRVHRDRLRRQPHPDSLSVEFFDALVHSVLCQDVRAAIASIDSALHVGLLRLDELDELFEALPRKYRRVRGLVDGRAESGPETLMRFILRSIRCSFDVQVRVRGVGRVDFLVDGWLIIECDSEEFHGEWDDRRRDLRRDMAAASRGFTTFRPIAEDIMWHPDRVRAAVVGLLSARSGVA
ncbi:hypothetical protein [Microbacterium sp.]|uniref:hypothetical protein n=1 Tax=Microbacterium sp. TaxID=51671 RepID=UPI003A8D30D2